MCISCICILIYIYTHICTYTSIALFIERERDYKELAHALMETGGSKICRAGQHPGDAEKSYVSVHKQNVLFIGILQSVFFQSLQLIGE